MLYRPLFRAIDEVRMLGRSADGAAVFGNDAVRLPHAHEHHFVDAAPDELARLFIQRLYLVARFEVGNLRLVVLVRAVGAPAPAAQARIPRHAMPRDGEGGRGAERESEVRAVE